MSGNLVFMPLCEHLCDLCLFYAIQVEQQSGAVTNVPVKPGKMEIANE